MSAWPDYELLDFGDGRKLERFGDYIFDRPALTATGAKQDRKAWANASVRFSGERVAAGEWVPPIEKWPGLPQVAVDLGAGDAFSMTLTAFPTGQLGIFPEQFDNWQWLAKQVRRAAQPLKVLNLFAYTGGSTLACAAAGASVVHIDAVSRVVGIAGINADLSGFANKPIRRITEDAMKFCQREKRRGNRYDAIILDPPTYGHGPKGEEWNIKRDLLPLLEICGELTERRPKFLLLTCHSPGIGRAELSAYLSEGIFGACGQPPRTFELSLQTADNRRLPSGIAARWPG